MLCTIGAEQTALAAIKEDHAGRLEPSLAVEVNETLSTILSTVKGAVANKISLVPGIALPGPSSAPPSPGLDHFSLFAQTGR